MIRLDIHDHKIFGSLDVIVFLLPLPSFVITLEVNYGEVGIEGVNKNTTAIQCILEIGG